MKGVEEKAFAVSVVPHHLAAFDSSSYPSSSMSSTAALTGSVTSFRPRQPTVSLHSPLDCCSGPIGLLKDKYHAPVAVCCGSIPKFQPRYAALRGRSIDSNLQFCGSSWITEEGASSQSMFTTRMMEQLSSWAGDGAQRWENSTGRDGDNKELLSEEKDHEASLLYCRRGPWTKLPPLLYPMPESPGPSDGAPGSTAVPLPRAQHLPCQETLKMWPRSGRRNEEKTLKPQGFRLPPINGAVASDPSMSDACREKCSVPASRKCVTRCPLPSIPVTHQRGRVQQNSSEYLKQMETEAVSDSEGDTSHCALGAVPQVGCLALGYAMLMPDPVLTVRSQRATALDFLDWEDEAEEGSAREVRPFAEPQQELLNALTWLSSDDWEQNAKGLFSIRCLAIHHSEVLLPRIHDVSLAVSKEVNNLRSKVSRFAIGTLGELFRTLKKNMDHDVDTIAQVLLQRTWDSSDFIQKAASRSLRLMVQNVTPARAMSALMASGIQHRNVTVRKCAAEHLLSTVEKIGAKKLLSGKHINTDVLVNTVVRLAQDSHQDTRYYGRQMLNILMSHEKFDKYLKQSGPSHDLNQVMETIKKKGVEDHKCEAPSAKVHKKPRKSSSTMPQDKLPSDGGLRSGSDRRLLPRRAACHVSLRTVKETDQLQELYRLLSDKDFELRLEGLGLLLEYCKSSPQLLSNNIVQIFDIFGLRLRDYNKKVTQQALEVLALMVPMLRVALHPVLVSLVLAVTENLNSKQSGIYAAATKVLEACIAHLDNTLMLQALAQRVSSLSGQALLDVTAHISELVTSVYPWKPQAAKRYGLPTLWFFLGSSVLPVRSGNVKAVVTKLAGALYQLMGSKLLDYAASQPQRVAKNLRDILELHAE
ncbi:TOG array regulator of axonemal microtubules protein 2-like [Porphyrio hochstetteri]